MNCAVHMEAERRYAAIAVKHCARNVREDSRRDVLASRACPRWLHSRRLGGAAGTNPGSHLTGMDPGLGAVCNGEYVKALVTWRFSRASSR